MRVSDYQYLCIFVAVCDLMLIYMYKFCYFAERIV